MILLARKVAQDIDIAATAGEIGKDQSDFGR
jgi:hypothetical protein